MKKTVVFLAVATSLILLLALDGFGLTSQEPKCQCQSQWLQMRQNTTEYTIARASNLDKLQKDVNERLKKDWHPIGGVSVIDSNSFCQAMIK